MNNQPSRGGPIALIVIGILAMIGAPIIGFIAAAMSMLGGLDIDQLSNAQTVRNGETVAISGAGTWLIDREDGH